MEREQLTLDALKTLEQTSRTFYIPIKQLPDQLLDCVGSAYLCMRAIDEIEDNSVLAPEFKIALLSKISLALQSTSGNVPVDKNLFDFLKMFDNSLPEVTVRLFDWIQVAPVLIAPRIIDATASMSDRMIYWVKRQWKINNIEDLNRYTFSVAGSVGLLLSDMWAWYDGTRTSRQYAVGFGRALQSVNILRNRDDDLERGVDFFPDGWGMSEMRKYSLDNLKLAQKYTESLPQGPIQYFCMIPLALAYATLIALSKGQNKLTRELVLDLVERLKTDGTLITKLHNEALGLSTER